MEVRSLLPLLFVPAFLAIVVLAKGLRVPAEPYAGPRQSPAVIARNWLRIPENAAKAVAVLAGSTFLLPQLMGPFLLAASWLGLWSLVRDPAPSYGSVRLMRRETWIPPAKDRLAR